MPGIAGRIGGGGKALSQGVDTMLHRMLHEPFYRSGGYVNDAHTVGLGAIFQEHSFTEGQPFWNESRNVCLVFAGECFGLDELSTVEAFSSSARSLLSLY